MSRLLNQLKEAEKKHDIFHEKIIDTYFGKPVKPKIAKKEPPSKKHYLLIIFVLLALFAMASIVNLIINNAVLNRKEAVSSFGKSYSRLLYNGVFDRNILKTFSFQGDAKQESLLLRNNIKLVNAENLGWARAIFRLNNTVDFSDANLLITGKSESGINNITLILSDAGGNSYEVKHIAFSPEWNLKNIELPDTKHFNFKKIAGISIEYGTVTVGNHDGAVIYIKEIGIRKKGGI